MTRACEPTSPILNIEGKKKTKTNFSFKKREKKKIFDLEIRLFGL